MALPKQHLPIFKVTLPSTGVEYKFRPFTVREEKVLALAQEVGQDDGQEEVIFDAITEIINACFDGKLSVDDMALFDVEYVLTQLRSKSVGEVIELILLCDENEEHKTHYKLDMSKIQVVFPENHNKTISLYDDVGVKMKYPTLKDMLNSSNDADSIDGMVACIDSIYDANEVYSSSDYTKAELRDWFESLSNESFEKINEQFFNSVPEYKHTIEYKCSECGKEHKKIIKGLTSFFI